MRRGLGKIFRFTAIALGLAFILVVLTALAFHWAAQTREVIAFAENLPEPGALVQTEEGQVFVLDVGDATQPQILFAHGTAAWSALWQPTLEAVADQGYRATAFDLPPFGWSEHATDRDYSRARQAERIIALLEALDTKPIIVAHSVGAGPMSEAVMRRPELVSGFVVVAGAIALGSHEDPRHLPLPLRNDTFRQLATASTATNPYLTQTFLEGFVHIKSAVTADMVAMLQEPIHREGYTKAVSDWIPVLFRSPIDALSTRAENWQALELPVAFIWGDKDTVTPLDQADALVALVPGAALSVLNGVGHIPQIEAPETFQQVLLKTLNKFSETAKD